MTHIPKPQRKKWDPKAREAVIIGFDTHTKGYRLYDPHKKDVIISRDVEFLDEGKLLTSTVERFSTIPTLN